MKRFLFILTLVGAVIFCPARLSAQIQIDRVMKPESGDLPEAVFPATHEFELSNGLKVFYIRSDRQATTMLQLIIKNIHAFGENSPAVADFAAVMLGKGTEEQSATRFAEAVDFLGASFSAAAFEDGLVVQGFTLSEFLPDFLPLFSEAILKPAFQSEELEKEKKTARSVLRAKHQEPAWLAGALFQKLMFGKHPYGSVLTPEIIDSIECESLKKFHDALFVPQNASLGVVSDLPKDEMADALEEAFACWKNEPATQETAQTEKLPHTEGISLNFVHRPGSVQSHILFGFKTFPFADTNKAAFSLVGAAFGSGYTGRLPYIFRELKGWSYETNAAGLHYKDAGVYVVSSDVAVQVTAEAVYEILFQLNRMKSEAMSERELTLQKDFTRGRFLFSLEEPATLVSRALELDLYQLPKNYFESFQQSIHALSPEHAFELAKRYFDTENFIVVIVGDGSVLKEELEELGEFQFFNTAFQPINPIFER
ncbi:peptidase M16 domain protein [Chloroherpeton thalassium ATCC 35110]|uniref:Peptidase M16 domain protein n=1 Tax=Chloroherpeton thalassium (strain ATCC 35110 / GB-78) TaxID=517418 RepID=B3QXK2_CHLT3|nr:pitrilysin family protein [Chloroherpeton thalassium]ACF14917.1 peptidase M16 domain protein [Chloroherpeton thalassium ATCC 35110]